MEAMTDRGASAGSYARDTDQPVRYYPITLRGETVGYLWASVTDDAASCLRRLAKKDESLRAYRVWDGRLRAAKARGLRPLEALRQWAGAPEEDGPGRLDDGAGEREAAGLAELREIANPGHAGPLDERRRRSRSSAVRRGERPPVPAGPGPGDYPMTAEGAVRYVPVSKGGVVLGYLWASAAGDAASYVIRRAAGDAGFDSAVPWRRALRAARESGLTPLEALERAIGTPEDERGGGVPAGTPVSEAPGLAVLRDLAAQ